MRYRLDDLGWLQFEELCQALLKARLGLGIEAWGGSGDHGRDAFFDGSLPFPSRDAEAAGPFVFQAKFVSGANAAGARPGTMLRNAVAVECRRIGRRRAKREWREVGQYVLLTNVVVSGNRRAALAKLVGSELPGTRVSVQDGRDISALLDATPRIRQSYPAILGLRDLTELLRAETLRDVVNRSSLQLELAQRLARVFVPTYAYRVALETLRRHNFAVLTGPPEAGKTSVARMVGLVSMLDGWEVYDCRRPEDFMRALRRDGADRQLFIVDDAFGSTEYRPDQAQEWADHMDGVLAALGPGHRMLWTSRPAILRAALSRLRFEGDAERFPAPAQVTADAFELTLRERVLIVYRHAKAAQLDENTRNMVRSYAGYLAGDPLHFTPERVRRVVSYELADVMAVSPGGRAAALSRAIRRQLREPTQTMKLAFASMPSNEQDLLVAMLDSGSSAILLTDLRDAYRRLTGRDDADASIEALTAHIIRVTDRSSVEWIHPSWRDLVIDQLMQDPRRRARFLGHCSLGGVLLALSSAGGAEGERRFPLLCEDADVDSLGQRVRELTGTLSDSECLRLLVALSEFPRRADRWSPRLAGVREVVASALVGMRARWNGTDEPIPVEQLARWFELSAVIEPPPASPLLYTTWDALNPRDALARVRKDRDGARNAAWTWYRLVVLIEENEPRILRQKYFPRGYIDVLEAISALSTKKVRRKTDGYPTALDHARERMNNQYAQLYGWAQQMLQRGAVDPWPRSAGRSEERALVTKTPGDDLVTVPRPEGDVGPFDVGAAVKDL